MTPRPCWQLCVTMRACMRDMLRAGGPSNPCHVLLWHTYCSTCADGGNPMATSSSATDQGRQPMDAPFLRQPPPTAEELLRCEEPIGPLKPEDWPQVDHLVTEDDTPVDNIYSEKQQRLLTQSLYDSWAGPSSGRSFITLANVGLFYGINQPPLVPDVLVSLDVELPMDIWEKRHRSYMIWEYGKAPEVVVELVSNKIGGEADVKLRTYARMGIAYYVI